jgi:hypothetical protein
MMFDIITIFLVGILLLVAVYTAIQFRGKFPKRTIEDVTPFLRPAEHDELESLLDPAQETNFRLRTSQQEFADWQRRRIHLLREYLLRMSHNALVLIEWGNMETATTGNDAETVRQRQLMAQELVQAATEFRLYSFIALVKLKVWLVMPSPLSLLLPSPSLPAMRHIFGIDALGSYERLRTAASSLSMAHGLHFHEALLERL